MKKYCVSLLLCLIMSIESHHNQNIPPPGERPIVVVIASYNNSDIYKRNLDSVFSQDYENYRVIYVDDCSPDGTGDLVEQYIQECSQQHRVTLIKNKERKRALANLYTAIHMCDNHEIVAILDGDDWFPHEHVLKRINRTYVNPDVWITYGQFVMHPEDYRGFCQPIPYEVVENNAFRSHQPQPSHLRTFYAGLFKRIKKEDLMYEGDFFQMTYDLAIMLPMMEMAGPRHKFIPDILYVYNNENPINDHKVSKELQRKLDFVIRDLPPYKRIDRLFD